MTSVSKIYKGRYLEFITIQQGDAINQCCEEFRNSCFQINSAQLTAIKRGQMSEKNIERLCQEYAEERWNALLIVNSYETDICWNPIIHYTTEQLEEFEQMIYIYFKTGDFDDIEQQIAKMKILDFLNNLIVHKRFIKFNNEILNDYF
jgi:hypothetical protein